MDRRSPRSERRSNVWLVVGSALFVIAGAAVWFVGHASVGLLALLFFGGCMIVGIMNLVGPHTLPGRVLAIVGALGMGAGCLALAIVAMNGGSLGPRGHPAVAIPIGLIGGIFFGGGAILLLVRLIRDRSRR